MLTKEIATNLENPGDCNLAAIAVPFFAPQNKQASSRIVNADAHVVNGNATENNGKLPKATAIGQSGGKNNYVIKLVKIIINIMKINFMNSINLMI